MSRIRTIAALVSVLVVAVASLAGSPAEARVKSPQNVHVSSSKGLYMVNWSAVKGATTYDVEFIPHDNKGKRLFGPYVPHWTKSTNFSIAMSKLPSPKFGFETVVYSNVVDSPKPVDPKTQDYSSKTKVTNAKTAKAALNKCKAVAAAIAAAGLTAEGGSLAAGAIGYLSCMDLR
jgi:hypothetical protein